MAVNTYKAESPLYSETTSISFCFIALAICKSSTLIYTLSLFTFSKGSILSQISFGSSSSFIFTLPLITTIESKLIKFLTLSNVLGKTTTSITPVKSSSFKKAIIELFLVTFWFTSANIPPNITLWLSWIKWSSSPNPSIIASYDWNIVSIVVDVITFKLFSYSSKGWPDI